MKKIKTEAKRIVTMLNLAGVTERTEAEILKYINQSGVDKVVSRLNELFDTSLQIGDYIIQSKSNEGFWSNDFGWCFNKEGATGFSESDLDFYKDQSGIPKPNLYDVPDAEFVLYSTAKSFK